MEIILLERVQNLGDLGDLVRVRPGYARNYLIPNGKATPATAENKAKFEQRRKELEDAAAAKLTEAKARAQAIDGAMVSIIRRASDEGKLFGSVGTVDIAEAMTDAGKPLFKAEIHLAEGPLKTIGRHEIPLTLHPEVDCTITVEVLAEAGDNLPPVPELEAEAAAPQPADTTADEDTPARDA